MHKVALLLLLFAIIQAQFTIVLKHNNVQFATSGFNFVLFRDAKNDTYYYGSIVSVLPRFEATKLQRPMDNLPILNIFLVPAQRMFAVIWQHGDKYTTTICMYYACQNFDYFVNAIGAQVSKIDENNGPFKKHHDYMYLLAQNRSLYNVSGNAVDIVPRWVNVTVPASVTRLVQATELQIIVLLGNSTLYELNSKKEFHLPGLFIDCDFSTGVLTVLDSTNTVYFFSDNLQFESSKKYRQDVSQVSVCDKNTILKGSDGYLHDYGDAVRAMVFMNYFSCPSDGCKLAVLNETIKVANCISVYSMHAVGLILTLTIVSMFVLIALSSMFISGILLLSSRFGCSSAMCMTFGMNSILSMSISAIFIITKMMNKESLIFVSSTASFGSALLLITIATHAILFRFVRNSSGEARTTLCISQIVLLVTILLLAPQFALSVVIISSVDDAIAQSLVLIGIICMLQLLNFALQLISICFAIKYKKIQLEQNHDALVLSVLYEKLENESEPLVSQSLAGIKAFEISFSALSSFEELGSGAQGIVLKAKWRNDPVAVKLFKQTVGDEEYAHQAFANEVTTLCSLRHKNIVNVYGAVVEKNRLGIVMELCATSLTALIIKQKLRTTEEKLTILKEIAQGMSYLHMKNIIHRDLKAENILIDDKGTAKISDFGASKDASSQNMTMLVGTAAYMAPEVVHSREYNFKCDVYSFGILMYEVLFDTIRPYGDTSFNVEHKVASDANFRPPIPTNRTYSALEQTMLTMMQQCWQHDANKRPTFDDLFAQL